MQEILKFDSKRFAIYRFLVAPKGPRKQIRKGLRDSLGAMLTQICSEWVVQEPDGRHLLTSIVWLAGAVCSNELKAAPLTDRGAPCFFFGGGSSGKPWPFEESACWETMDMRVSEFTHVAVLF